MRGRGAALVAGLRWTVLAVRLVGLCVSVFGRGGGVGDWPALFRVKCEGML